MKNLDPWYIFFTSLASLANLLPVAFAVSGDTQCSAEFCITAINHNNATTSYDLTVTAPQVGWVSMGFGRSMITAPLVVLWRDPSNGNTIVSQRKASDYVEPTVDPNPPLVAMANNYRAVSNSSATTLSFSVPSTTDTQLAIIYAWSKIQPSGNTIDTTLIEHDVQGELTLNMANQLPDSLDGPTPVSTTIRPTATSISGNNNNFNAPLTHTQRAFATHGILLSLAFLVILPFGALQARYLRTFIPGKWWFTAHWILQWPGAGLLILAGWLLASTQKTPDSHVSEGHRRWGVVIICSYVFQCCLGGIIHFVKPARSTTRPPQNYAHGFIGVVIIALSFWQVYTGLNVAWPLFGGFVPQSVRTWWKVWIVMLPVIYAAGLAFLPRQYKMEAEQRKERTPPPGATSINLQDRQERRYSYSAVKAQSQTDVREAI